MESKITIGAIAAIIIGIGVAVGISSFGDDEEEVVSDVTVVEDTKEYDKVPDFSLKDFNGNTVSLADSEGQIRVLNSWATWCPFCVNELPDFAALQEEFGEQIVVIAIGRAESKEKAIAFTNKTGVTDRMTFLLDPTDSFYKSIGGFAMPETLFVDGAGNIRFHKRGPIKLNEMRTQVEAITGRRAIQEAPPVEFENEEEEVEEQATSTDI